MTAKSFSGFENYRLLILSPDYWDAARVTLVFVVLTAVPSVLLGLAIALLIDLGPWAPGFFRTLFAMPIAVSSSMSAMLWIFLFNPASGYLNYLLDLVGINGRNWLGDNHWALFSVSLATVWKEIGFSIVFYLAGLSGIQHEIKEAAAIDGASALRTIYHIIIPLLRPTLVFVSIVAVLSSFQSFGQIHILTGGGPASSTTTLVYNLYRDAFQNFQTGSASAQAVVLFLILTLATWLQFQITRKRAA